MRAPLFVALSIVVSVVVMGLALVPREAAAMDDPGWVSKVKIVTPDGGSLPPPAQDSSGRLYSRPKTWDAPCTSVVQTVIAVGTTAVTVPTSRAYSSIGVEIENSVENAGSPKLKCTADPVDGGVGMGTSNLGTVKGPGDPMFFGLDPSHTIKCISDTAGTAVTTSECVP